MRGRERDSLFRVTILPFMCRGWAGLIHPVTCPCLERWRTTRVLLLSPIPAVAPWSRDFSAQAILVTRPRVLDQDHVTRVVT